MRERDMTQGRPIRLILLFALPIMLGNVFQQLYIIVDAAFVGRLIGMEALDAIGITDWINWMVLGLVTGFTQGFSIIIAQRFGSGDRAGMHRAVGTSVLLTVLAALAILVLGQSLLSPLLRLMRTPVAIQPLAETYTRIIMGGVFLSAAYNLAACILRAVGDAKTPLYAMVIASLTNIALDALLIAGLGMGIAGAALGTILSQGVAAVYCFMVLRRSHVMRAERRAMRLEPDMARVLMRIATPSALQNLIIGAGGIVVQSVINPYDTLVIAGFTAVNKLYGLLELAAISFGAAVTTYVGQNMGAHRIERIRQGVRDSALLSVAVSVVISAVMLVLGRSILSLFITDANPAHVEAALDVGQQYLNVMLFMLWTLYLLYVYRSALQGMGDTVTPMISGGVELALRVGAILLLPHFFGENGLYYAEISAWAGAALLLAVGYYRHMHALCRSGRM